MEATDQIVLTMVKESMMFLHDEESNAHDNLTWHQ